MKNLFSYILALVCLLTYSCKEVYDAKITNDYKILVVDGMITDERKPFSVRLNTAIRFDSTGYLSETGANVYVTDNDGNQYKFQETSPGTYTSNPQEFITHIGKKYTLTIETKDNKVYKSSEQELLPKGTLNDATNVAKVTNFYITINEVFRTLVVRGAEFTSSFNLMSEPNPYYRFSNTVFIEFIQRYSFQKDVSYFSWMKYSPNEYFNINNRQYNKSDQFEHDFGFFPIDSAFYGIVLTPIFPKIPGGKIQWLYQDVYLYVVSLKQYHLNNDIYDYYELLNKQLEANQHIFDPISSQVSGNIRCISDPKLKAFGLFEASSQNLLTYTIDYNLSSSSYNLKKIAFDTDSISDSGTNDSIPPSFWIN